MTIDQFREILKSTPANRNNCIEWPLGRYAQGYGMVDVRGRKRKAHVLAYEIFTGPVPSGKIVRHTCDNPPCFNPAHLITGTRLDNSVDMVIRGRSARGEKHGKAKLTEKLVLEIRSRYAHGFIGLKSLAVRYGVNWVTVRDIVNRKTWRHI